MTLAVFEAPKLTYAMSDVGSGKITCSGIDHRYEKL